MAGLSAFQDKAPGWFKIEANQSKEVFIPLELKEMTRAVVHNSPSNFMKSAICTWEDDELCYACQQGTFAWGAKVRIFIPVIENGKLNIMSQGTGKNSLIWPLGRVFQETGTSVGWFDLNRTGLGKRSKYTAEPIDKAPPMRYTKKVDLSSHLREVDYKDQATYYS